MKKLKLESLDVISFETSVAASGLRGTVRGHSVVPTPPSAFFCEPTDANMDCTYGCSYETVCAVACGFTEGPDCA